jgi:hypothetical protein
VSNPRKPFAYRPSKESLLHVRHASAEEKLQWLEEANAFVRQFLDPAKRERWRAYIAQDEDLRRE